MHSQQIFRRLAVVELPPPLLEIGLPLRCRLSKGWQWPPALNLRLCPGTGHLCIPWSSVFPSDECPRSIAALWHGPKHSLSWGWVCDKAFLGNRAADVSPPCLSSLCCFSLGVEPLHRVGQVLVVSVYQGVRCSWVAAVRNLGGVWGHCLSKHQYCHCCPTEDLPKNQVTTGLGWCVFPCSGCPRFRAILLYQCARPDCLLCLGWGAARSMQETWQVLDQTSLHCALRVTHMCCVPHEWSPGFPSLFFPAIL